MLLQMECEKIISLISSKQSWQQNNFRCLYSWLITIQIFFWQFYFENYTRFIVLFLLQMSGEFSFVSAFFIPFSGLWIAFMLSFTS